MLVIAKQVALQIAGYRDHDEFASDGCRFAPGMSSERFMPRTRVAITSGPSHSN
jgi:hypothetical protein